MLRSCDTDDTDDGDCDGEGDGLPRLAEDGFADLGLRFWTSLGERSKCSMLPLRKALADILDPDLDPACCVCRAARAAACSAICLTAPDNREPAGQRSRWVLKVRIYKKYKYFFYFFIFFVKLPFQLR